MDAGAARRGLQPTGRKVRMWLATPVAAVLAAVTFIHLGHGADAAVWSGVQVILVVLAVTDFAEHRLPNAITLPTAAGALVLRALFERSHLAESAIAGAAAFAAFYVLALIARGGFGMGDVKLAGMLGFLLGSAVFGALVIGTVAGGVAALLLIAGSRANLRSSIAYGPYLALGAAIAVYALGPPPLV